MRRHGRMRFWTAPRPRTCKRMARHPKPRTTVHRWYEDVAPSTGGKGSAIRAVLLPNHAVLPSHLQPFCAERPATASDSSRKMMVVHVGLLTGTFSLMQLFFAPLWGRFLDHLGRRPILLLGMIGYGVAHLLFGMATSLRLLCGARILGGILASATVPAATADVADDTSNTERGRGMAWLGMVFIPPNRPSLTSKRSDAQTGTALGLQNAASNLGQVARLLLGGTLSAWKAGVPCLLTSVFLPAAATVIT